MVHRMERIYGKFYHIYIISAVILFSTGTPGIFATLVYVITMRVGTCDTLAIAIILRGQSLPVRVYERFQ